jgi:dihydrofolate reductase
MPRIVVSEFLSLDGVMPAPGGPDEDRSGGFDQGGWQMGYFDDVFGKLVTDAFEATGGFLLGRRTYDIFASYWPNQSNDEPLAQKMNELPKHVASRTLSEPLGWQNSRLLSGDVVGAVRELRAHPGREIQVIGSGDFVQTLIANDLVDAYRLMIHPLVLGAGKRLFRDGTALTRLRLLDSATTPSGVMVNTYVPAGG